jgi:hypothetical protein
MLPSADVMVPMRQVLIDANPFPKLPGYVGAYVEALSKQESPKSFHALAIMTCVGAALQRKCVLDMEYFKVLPNMSVVLTGPAGGPKKTTAWDLALATVQASMRGSHIRIINDASPQSLVEELARDQEDAVGMIWAPEFRNFFPSSKYMEGAVPLVTRLLDGPSTYPVARITRKVKEIKNVCLSMAGGSTLDWMAKLPEDAQGGGFLTRVVVVHEEKGKEATETPREEALEKAALVRDMLAGVGRYGVGEIKMDRGAKAWFDDWYASSKVSKGLVPRLVLYYNRKQIHLLRAAMLLSLPARTLRRQDMESALGLMDWIEKPMADVYRLIGMSRSGEQTKGVLDIIRSSGGVIDFHKLAREMKGRLNSRELATAIETLKGAGNIREVRSAVEHKIIVKELGVIE